MKKEKERVGKEEEEKSKWDGQRSGSGTGWQTFEHESYTKYPGLCAVRGTLRKDWHFTRCLLSYSEPKSVACL